FRAAPSSLLGSRRITFVILPEIIVRHEPVQLVPGNADRGRELADLRVGDRVASEGLEGQCKEAVSELVARRLGIRLGEVEQRGEGFPVPIGFLLPQRVELHLAEEAQVLETVERRKAAHPEGCARSTTSCMWILWLPGSGRAL